MRREIIAILMNNSLTPEEKETAINQFLDGKKREFFRSIGR